jgi:hypothetical protein
MKGPMPSIELDVLSIGEMVVMNRAELDNILYELKKWKCHCKNCPNGTKVRDYGISPWYFLERNSKNSRRHPFYYWKDLTNIMWLCGKHRMIYERLIKKFAKGHVYERMIGPYYSPLKDIIPLSDANMKTVKQIEREC